MGTGDGYIGTDGFQYAKDALDSDIQYILADVYDFFDEWEEEFDIVLCFGVLYHVEKPKKLIEGISKIAREMVVFETAAFPSPLGRPFLYSNDGATENLLYTQTDTYVPTVPWIHEQFHHNSLELTKWDTHLGSHVSELMPFAEHLDELPVHRLLPSRYIAQTKVNQS